MTKQVSKGRRKSACLMPYVPRHSCNRVSILVHEYKKLWNKLHRLQASDDVVRLEHLFRCGNPTQEILRAAQTLHCDLIVMGTHRRTWIGRLLRCSVAQGVLRAAPCAVLTTPSVEPARKQAAARQVAATVP